MSPGTEQLALGICDGVISCVNDGVRIIFGKGTELKIQQSKLYFSAGNQLYSLDKHVL